MGNELALIVGQGEGGKGVQRVQLCLTQYSDVNRLYILKYILMKAL